MNNLIKITIHVAKEARFRNSSERFKNYGSINDFPQISLVCEISSLRPPKLPSLASLTTPASIIVNPQISRKVSLFRCHSLALTTYERPIFPGPYLTVLTSRATGGIMWQWNRFFDSAASSDVLPLRLRLLRITCASACAPDRNFDG